MVLNCVARRTALSTLPTRRTRFRGTSPQRSPTQSELELRRTSMSHNILGTRAASHWGDGTWPTDPSGDFYLAEDFDLPKRQRPGDLLVRDEYKLAVEYLWSIAPRTRRQHDISCAVVTGTPGIGGSF